MEDNDNANKSLFCVASILCEGAIVPTAEKEKSSDVFSCPDPVRLKQHIETYREWDRRNSLLPEAVLFAGSSSISRWPTTELFGDVPVINRGISGYYVVDVLHYMNTLVLKYMPKVAVIYAGDNNIDGGLTAENVHRDLSQLIDHIHLVLPQIEIVCLALKPSIRR